MKQQQTLGNNTKISNFFQSTQRKETKRHRYFEEKGLKTVYTF